MLPAGNLRRLFLLMRKMLRRAGYLNWDGSSPSSFRSALFTSSPPAYPVRLPFEPTTRWQGIMMEIGLWPTAPPMAWLDMEERPSLAAAFFARAP